MLMDCKQIVNTTIVTDECMIRLINTALSKVMIKLKLLVGGAIDPIDPPYLVWNVDIECIVVCNC